jgi:hypothetical protein
MRILLIRLFKICDGGDDDDDYDDDDDGGGLSFSRNTLLHAMLSFFLCHFQG